MVSDQAAMHVLLAIVLGLIGGIGGSVGTRALVMWWLDRHDH